MYPCRWFSFSVARFLSVKLWKISRPCCEQFPLVLLSTSDIITYRFADLLCEALRVMRILFLDAVVEFLYYYYYYYHYYYIVRTTVKNPFMRFMQLVWMQWQIKPSLSATTSSGRKPSSSTALWLQKTETDANGSPMTLCATGHFIPLRLCIHNNLINRIVLSSFYHDIPIALFLVLFPTITTFLTCTLFGKKNKKTFRGMRPFVLVCYTLWKISCKQLDSIHLTPADGA